MAVTLISLDGRSDTGDTRPFLGEADDGHSYYVKSGNTSPGQRVKGYLFARLAEEFGLPVAPVEIVEIPEDLAFYSLLDSCEFRSAKALGSQRIPFADDLRASHLIQVEESLRFRTLCFDWWVRSDSRHLALLGGDTNALWDPVLQQMFLIDFDSSLAGDFDPASFRARHAFRDSLPFLERAQVEKWRTTFESAIYHIGRIWEEIPGEWLTDATGDSLIPFHLHDVEVQLMKPEFAFDALLPG